MAKDELRIQELKVKEKELEVQKSQNEMIQHALDKVIPIADKYFNNKLTAVEGPKIRWSIIGFVLLLFVIVIITGILVYNGKLDGGNFTFMLGTLIGSAITLLGDIILPKE